MASNAAQPKMDQNYPFHSHFKILLSYSISTPTQALCGMFMSQTACLICESFKIWFKRIIQFPDGERVSIFFTLFIKFFSSLLLPLTKQICLEVADWIYHVKCNLITLQLSYTKSTYWIRKRRGARCDD